MNTIVKITLICVFPVCNLFSQNIKLFGWAKDSSGVSLENVFISVASDNFTTTYNRLTDRDGKFEIWVDENTTYTIAASLLGFESDTIKTFIGKKKNEINFKLKSTAIELKSVTILEKSIPVVVKGDTIQYNIKSFTNGEERKLREILSKLPGIEVDDKGNVTANGKKITKFMVDGKTFFYGDTKLGVNNIPADVVGNVQVINNYSEIPFLKGFNDDDKTALNITLRADRHKFVFGDVEAGGGLNSKYGAHPNVFYYSPKIAINSILEINNYGQSSFSIDDYFNFEGGLSKLFNKPESFKNIAQSPFLINLFNPNFTYKKTEFGALNFIFTPNGRSTITLYTINNFENLQNAKLIQNSILANSNILLQETKNTNSSNANLISMNKLTCNQYISDNENLNYELSYKVTNGTGNQNTNYSSISNNSTSAPFQNFSSTLSQSLDYSKRFSKRNTLTSNVLLDYNSNRNNQTWNSDEALFISYLSNKPDSLTDIFQTIRSEAVKLSVSTKDEILINSYNHLYLTVGLDVSNQTLKTVTLQQKKLDNFDLQNLGFDNTSHLNLNDSYFGLSYRSKIQKFILKFGLNYHYYLGYLKQADAEKKIFDTPQVLPEVLIEWKHNSYETVKLRYLINSQFQDVSQYADRLVVTDFNALYSGVTNLKNDLINQFSINYSHLNLLGWVSFNATASANLKNTSTQNTLLLYGFNQIVSPIYANFADDNLSLRYYFSKNIKRLKISFNGNSNQNTYTRILNNVVTNYNSMGHKFSINLESYFSSKLNFNIAISRYLSNLKTVGSDENYVQNSTNCTVSYKISKDFFFKSLYSFSYLNSERSNQNNYYNNLNFSLEYSPKSTPFRYIFMINNASDVRFKEEASISQSIASYSKISVQPRVMVLKMHFKL